MSVAAASSTSPLWFITRATGVVSLILLMLTVALGVANVRRLRLGGAPRFVLDAIHRNSALLSVAFVGAHVLTSVLDGYVPIRLLDAFVPFGGAYRPFWLGLGAISVDLLIAVMATSLLRRHLGYRAWRATHWLAYGSWPVALAHSLGIGTDATTTWMLLTALGCLAVVGAALLARMAYRDRDHGRARPVGRLPSSVARRPVPRPERPLLSATAGRR